MRRAKEKIKGISFLIMAVLCAVPLVPFFVLGKLDDITGWMVKSVSPLVQSMMRPFLWCLERYLQTKNG